MLQRSPVEKSRAPPNKHLLNDRFIGDLAANDKPYLVWDIKQAGLAVRVEPTGYRSFKCIYSRQGRPRWYHIGNANKTRSDENIGWIEFHCRIPFGPDRGQRVRLTDKRNSRFARFMNSSRT